MTSSEVPFRFPVAIADHVYQIDPKRFRRESIALLRQQSDQSPEIGEHSLNPRGPWHRSQDSWHRGAGQDFYDGKIGGTVADSERFDIATGADIWTKGEVSNLPNAVTIRSSGTYVIAVGNTAYIIDGQQVHWAVSPDSGTSWTSADIHAGDAAVTVRSITTDGSNVWAALGTSGIHRTVRGASSSTANVPAAPGGGNVGMVGFALGRLLAAGSDIHASQRNVLWEVTSPLGATPALAPSTGAAGLYFSHPNTAFVWEGAAPGRGCIYAWGNVPSGPINLNLGLEYGGRAEIYRIGLNPTDTSLTAPTLATHLPDGESIHALTFYAGGIILGTSRGFRLGVADAQGNIDYGPVVKTLWPVCALEPQGQFCWFGMPEQEEAVSGDAFLGGLGRMDLATPTDTLVPAWSQDLGMSTSDLGNVTSIASVAGGASDLANLIWAVNSGGFSSDPRGIYRVDPAGTVWDAIAFRTGRISFSTAEPKRLINWVIEHDPLPANCVIDASRRVNGGAWIGFGSNNQVVGSTQSVFSFGLGGLAGVKTVELGVKAVLSSGTVPIRILNWTLRGLPTPVRKPSFTLPLLLRPEVLTNAGDGDSHAVDVAAEKAHLETIEREGQIVEVQVGHTSYQAIIEDSVFEGENWIDQGVSDSSSTVRELAGVHTVRIIPVA